MITEPHRGSAGNILRVNAGATTLESGEHPGQFRLLPGEALSLPSAGFGSAASRASVAGGMGLISRGRGRVLRLLC